MHNDLCGSQGKSLGCCRRRHPCVICLVFLMGKRGELSVSADYNANVIMLKTLKAGEHLQVIRFTYNC